MEQITFTRQRRIWRVQGDFLNGELFTLHLEAFWEEVWITPEGEIINTIRTGTPVTLAITQVSTDIQQAFMAIQTQFTELINSIDLNAPKVIESSPEVEPLLTPPDNVLPISTGMPTLS